LFFANRGEFRSRDAEEIMNKASSLSLLSNAVLVWNTLRITEIVNQLRAASHTIADQELNQSKHSASLCFSTRTCRPAEIKRARLATCRMPVGADRSRQ
jgi:hypothetical protein